MQIKLDNGFTFTYTEEGEWFYKADGVPFAKKAIERPAYPVIEEMEENYVQFFNKMLTNLAGEIKQEIE